jgi:hypothetical protein
MVLRSSPDASACSCPSRSSSSVTDSRTCRRGGARSSSPGRVPVLAQRLGDPRVALERVRHPLHEHGPVRGVELVEDEGHRTGRPLGVCRFFSGESVGEGHASGEVVGHAETRAGSLGVPGPWCPRHHLAVITPPAAASRAPEVARVVGVVAIRGPASARSRRSKMASRAVTSDSIASPRASSHFPSGTDSVTDSEEPSDC